MGVLPSFYQGFFLAPTVAAGALKGAVFAANVFEKLGYDVIPVSYTHLDVYKRQAFTAGRADRRTSLDSFYDITSEGPVR